MSTAIPDIKEADCRLWLPGQGDLSREQRIVARAIRDYDEALRFKQHTETGDWVVTVGDQGFPVLRICGPNEAMPDYAATTALLEKRDAKRQGRKIMDQLAREAQKRRDDSKYRASEQNGELAEHYYSARRRLLGENGTLRGRTPYLGGVKRNF